MARLARYVLCAAAMENVLIDPSLRKARITRATVGALLAVAVGAALLFARDLRGGGRPAPTLPSPRRAIGGVGRRQLSGRRPRTGQPARPERAATPAAGAASPAAGAAPRPVDAAQLEVIAFLDPSVRGALASLERHADRIHTVAATGLLLGDRGAVIDRSDPQVVKIARAHGLRTTLLLQNLDASTGAWRPDRVRALGRDRRGRQRLAAELERLLRARQVDGVQLDLEEVDDDEWRAVVAVVRDVAARLGPSGLEVGVDVPASLDGARLAELGHLADRVVVMAYDEHDEDAPPGPIASERFVEETLAGAARRLPPGKLTAALGIYGYEWIDQEPADPISFVDAHSAAREAHAQVDWDEAAGNPHFRYLDDEGTHEIWLLDAATLWNQRRLAARAGARAIALWRLGGEDPGVWDALGPRARPADLERVAPDERVDNQGDGPFLSLALSPAAGERTLTSVGDRLVERWRRSPSPWLIRRGGLKPGLVALTFDDGPDRRHTGDILDILDRTGAPASFFVVGSSAAQAPDLLRRAFAAGHEIGNHSFTHPNVDGLSDLRLQVELESTSRLIETIIGRRPLLYRPPSLADIEPRTASGAAAFARAGSLGYLVVDADIDPRDWEQPSAAELTARVLDEAEGGGVILLHDGGGDRSTTVAALPAIIDGLRKAGLRIVPLAQLVDKRRDEVMPPAILRSPLAAAAGHAVFGGAVSLLRAGRLCLLLGVGLVALRAILLLALALVSSRRQGRRLVGPLPSVTAVVPAFNEREVILRTVASVLASDLPLEVIVVDDGSTDGTAELVRSRYADDPRVRVYEQPNRGKSAALRTGFAAARSEVVVALDGDTLFAPATVRRLIAPFADRRVGAVAGTAEVGNRENGLTACQALEYLVQQELERRAWDAFGALPIVPGAVGAWRRRAVVEVGGFSSSTLAEDADLAMALCRAGWRVVHAPGARARTEAPSSLRALVKQRVRWSFGILQAMWKHRRALVEPRAGAFGRIVLPSMILFQVLLPLVTPLALISTIAALAGGHYASAVWVGLALFAAELVHVAAAFRLERRDERRAQAPLYGWALASHLLYRPVLLTVALRSLWRALDGIPLGWGKLARRGTVPENEPER